MIVHSHEWLFRDLGLTPPISHFYFDRITYLKPLGFLILNKVARMNKKKIIIFDTTLRDGEQSPGASMNTSEKIQIASQLERLGVDVIEAGFAAASPGDFDAIDKISQRVTSSIVCSLSLSSSFGDRFCGNLYIALNSTRK